MNLWLDQGRAEDKEKWALETSVGRVVLSFLLPAGVCVNIDPLPLLLAGGGNGERPLTFPSLSKGSPWLLKSAIIKFCPK